MKQRLRRVNIFLPGSHIEAATVAIARFGKLHINERHEDEWQEPSESWHELAEHYDGLRTRVEQLFSTFGMTPPSAAEHTAPRPADQADILTQSIEEAEGEIGPWREELDKTNREIDRLTLLERELDVLSPLDIPIEEIRDPEFEHWIVGTMTRDNLERLKIVLFRIPAVIIPVHVEHDRALVVGATSRDHQEFIERAMRGVFLDPLELPKEVSGKPSKAIQTVREKLQDARRRREELLEIADRLRESWRHRLGGLYRTLEKNSRLTTAITRFDRHRDTYLISGWVPEHDVRDLLMTLESSTGGAADVELADPRTPDAQEPPSMMRNPRFFKPFETIVSVFGLPRHREIDPTPLVAITFTLMYGMMFGDVGHGALVAIAGMILRYRLRGTGRAIGSVLTIAGIASMIFGFLYGSLFGREDILPTIWLQPLTGITALLLTSVLAGVVLLNVGFLVHLVMMVQNHDWPGFLLEPNGLAGIAFYWGILGGGYALIRGYIPVGMFLIVLIVPMALLFFKEPLARLIRRERPLLKEGGGTYAVRAFFEVFESLLSNLSNTLSFVRIGAFAVAHAGLMRAVFALAERSSPVGSALIIVMGTAIVIGLEGVIVGIQALRLEYYEFFGKFFSGGGTRFRPFTLSGTGE